MPENANKIKFSSKRSPSVENSTTQSVKRLPDVPTALYDGTSTQTSQHVIKESLEPPGNGKNAKGDTTKATTSKFSPNFAISILRHCLQLSNTILYHYNPQNATNNGHWQFHQKSPKSRKYIHFAQEIPQTLPFSTTEHLDDVARVRTNLRTLSDVVSQPSALPTSASSGSLPTSESYPNTQEKSEVHLDFESQPPSEHTAPTFLSTALKMRSISWKTAKKLKYTLLTLKIPRNQSSQAIPGVRMTLARPRYPPLLLQATSRTQHRPFS